MLNTLVKNKNKINYRNLSYKLLLSDGKFSLLEKLVAKKTTVSSANADQISFIINLMHGYNDWNFDKKTQIDLEKGRLITLS